MNLKISFSCNGVNKIISLLDNEKATIFLTVYLSFFLDNVLLTVVVPIIPDYLFSTTIHEQLNGSTASIVTSSASTPEGATSLSPLQRKYVELEQQNGPLGALLASKAFVQLAFTPIVGYFTGIIGYQLPLLLGNINMLIASLLFAYGNSYTLLVLARALHGSSSAAVSVSGMSLLAETLPIEPRAKLMPIAFGGIALGVLIGYPLGGAAYELLGKSAPFLMVALLIGINIGILFWQFKYTTENISESDSISVIEPPNPIGWKDLAKNKSTMICCGAICISSSCMAILEPCVPMWLMGHISPPPTKWQLGAVFIPDSLGYFIGSHFAGLFPIDPWRTALIGMLFTGLGALSLPIASTLGQLILPHFAIGLGVGTVDAALVPHLAYLVDVITGQRDIQLQMAINNRISVSPGTRHYYGLVYTLQQAAVSIAYAFGPLLGGEAVQNGLGFGWMMRLVGSLNVIYTPVLMQLEKTGLGNGYIMEDDSLPSYSSFDKSVVPENW